MQHTVTANTPANINLQAAFGRDARTLTFENRGATSIFLVPGVLPLDATQLPDVAPTGSPAWDASFTTALGQYCRRCGYELKAGERLSRSVVDGREIAMIWSADADTTNTALHSIIEK